MSGICGICLPGAPLYRTALEPMLAALALPGDAGQDHLAERSIAMGVARRWTSEGIASIPGVFVATDADPCNLAELRADVGRHGVDASELSVAEIFAWLFKFDGHDFLLRPRGAFSVAVWDEAEQRLLLAIDRFGMHSLYWCRQGERLQFATRAGAIRAAQDSPTAISPASIVQFLLFSAIPAPLTAYQDISKLEPGSLLLYEGGKLLQQRYWDLEYTEDHIPSASQWAGQLRETMRASVHAHLEGCVPERTGAYLSGGTDSSSVVAFMTEACCPVNTFCIFFEDPRYSEIEFARTTAECFHARHKAKAVSAQEAFDSIAKIAGYFDEPFANSSAIGAYYCALIARENGVDTLLAGDGGDELFAGNERYATDKYFQLYQKLPGWLRHGVIEPLVRVLPEEGNLSLPRRYVRRATTPNPRRLLSYCPLLGINPSEIFKPEFLEQAPPETWMEIPERHFQRAPGAQSELNRLLYLDIKMALADNDLRKVLGTAELAGVRVRFPLLDTRVAEISSRIPSDLKLNGLEKRYIFKLAMKKILPDKVLRKKKHGFGVPVGKWLLQHREFRALMQDVLGDRASYLRTYFCGAFLDKLQLLHQEHAGYYGEVVWYLLMLELWHRRQRRGIRDFAHAD
jgi:asparagine synthase (glutamine-hydrolysing)